MSIKSVSFNIMYYRLTFIKFYIDLIMFYLNFSETTFIL